jgi:hypothetical protein
MANECTSTLNRVTSLEQLSEAEFSGEVAKSL